MASVGQLVKLGALANGPESETAGVECKIERGTGGYGWV
jgi:hypothetical protein